MARLCQARSSPLPRIHRSTREKKKCRNASRRVTQTAGNFDICSKYPGGRNSNSRTVTQYQSNLELNELSKLLEVTRNVKRLKERWLALGFFCALAFMQCCIWNTWGPIAGSAMMAFPSWHKSLVALLSNWGCITYLTCCFPCCWLLYTKGLLIPIRLAAILSSLATFIRCLSSQEIIFTTTAHIAAILNGLSGVIVGPATALVSGIWFPSGERTTATGISAAFNQLGMALSYLIGPAIVGIPVSNATYRVFNVTENIVYARKKYSVHSMPRIAMDSDAIKMFPNATFDHVALRVQIMSFMRIEMIAQLLVLFGVLWLFPKQPYTTVETSTTQSSHLTVLDSILRLLNNKNMWRLCLAAALSQGVTGPWLAMITMTFGPAVTQDEADRLAFWTIICSSVLSLTASRVMDIFQGHLKIAIYTLLAVSSAMFLWVLLLDSHILSFHKHELYTAVILGISASWSTPALFLELASEIAFPISEAIVGGYMIFLANVIGSMFYFLYFVPEMGEHWSSYCVFGNLTLAFILVIYVKEEYNRTKLE
ncbi:disrupted in renal carcinoma protein 2 [Cephus cinctus]|uniref:Disrupted in renal carcinoma protein 2 n=1 Tax=Cephus cinctus TaxID=211228 RepID=A0AAJ7BWG5_CEPCN|nr:disrupted in renal carcinoma protein 2 [Cephus cinctus]